MGRLFRSAEALLLLLLLGWLGLAAALVAVEYYDGYDSVRNARYFLGRVDAYVATRGPVLGFLILPAEWLRDRMGLSLLDVRLHHAVSAVLHAAYLLGCYRLASRSYGRGLPVLLAFCAAVPTFLFFSYGPFLSHDLLPGLFFLLLLFGADSYMVRPRPGLWIGLVCLGALAALTKHTYALFWIVALLAQAHHVFGRRRAWFSLLGASLASGLLTILVLGSVLREAFPDLSLVERGYRQTVFLLFEAGARSIVQPAWVYIRNWPAFGLLAMLLLPFGFFLSWREGGRQRGLVLAWALAALALHLTPLRQVRYLLFLAPVSLCILVPVMRVVAGNRLSLGLALGLLVVGVLPVHPYSIWSEAGRVTDPFYRRSEASAFLEPLLSAGPGGVVRRSPVYYNWGLLSFLPPGESVLAGDVYHGLFHLGPEQVADLFGYSRTEWIAVRPDDLAALSDWPERAAFIGTTRAPQFNPATWERGPASDRFEQRQRLFLAKTIEVESSEVGLVTNSGDLLTIETGQTDRGEALTLLEGRSLDLPLDAGLPIRATVAGAGRPYLVRAVGPGRWLLPRALVVPEPGGAPFLRLQCFEGVREYPDPGGPGPL